jgi:FkbM family methyltransferase
MLSKAQALPYPETKRRGFPVEDTVLSLPKRLFRSLFRRAGFEITRVENKPAGVNGRWIDQLGGKQDAFSDIKRLSQAWNLEIKCFFDVGANDGTTSKAALSYFTGVHVFAFEPHPRTFLRLRENISGPRLQSFNIALGDRNGEAELFSYENDKINSLVHDASFAVRFDQKSNPIKIHISTIDDFSSTHGIDGIDVLKIDTEGSELSVLKGAARKLARRKIRFVYTEFNDLFEQPGRTGGALFPIYKYLCPFGFRFVAAYTDCLATEGEFFGVHNALFAVPASPHTGLARHSQAVNGLRSKSQTLVLPAI